MLRYSVLTWVPCSYAVKSSGNVMGSCSVKSDEVSNEPVPKPHAAQITHTDYSQS